MVQCPGNQTYDSQLQACCTNCPAGSGVALPCQATNDTVCEPCRSGVEWSEHTSHLSNCETCYNCPPNAHVTHQCNSTHNTKCACNPGYFGRSITADRFACYECSKCAPGQYTLRACDHLHDTVCASCPSGTHSPHAGAIACRACRKCPGGSATLKKCSGEMDTICEGSPLIPHDPLDGSARSDLTNSHASAPSDFNLIPVYCTFLGAIFVGLVIYVIAKRLNCRCCGGGKKLSKQKTLQPGKSSKLDGNAYSNVPHSASCHNIPIGIPCEQVYMKTAHRPASMWNNNGNTSPSKNSHKSGSLSSSKTPLPTMESQQRLLPISQSANQYLDASGKASKLPSPCINQLASMMDGCRTPDDRYELWYAVARRLGYGDEQQQLRERALIAGESVSSLILRRWNEDASSRTDVAQMVKILQHYRRPDMVQVICQQSSACIYNV